MILFEDRSGAGGGVISCFGTTGWMSLTVVAPELQNRIVDYQRFAKQHAG
jgi:hypothetical protein